MTGMKIEDYNKQGFRISHPQLPKAVWVDFDQLPLTRLSIHNGVIDDEITFVENIVNHRMQLIRTLDTEYVDLIYKEKALDEKKDHIIPITQAIPGQIYIGAQCEEGNEMIFLGLFYAKAIKSTNNGWSSWNNKYRESKFYMSKLTPQRAFFAIPDNSLTKAEEKEIERKYFSDDNQGYGSNMKWEERDRLSKLCNAEKQQTLKNSTVARYKIVDFPVTSKRIKEVILTQKCNKHFENEMLNREVIMRMLNNSVNYPEPEVDFKITNHWYEEIKLISKTKASVEDETRGHYLTYYHINLEDKYYENRHENR
jgi:hypothetical protein